MRKLILSMTLVLLTSPAFGMTLRQGDELTVMGKGSCLILSPTSDGGYFGLTVNGRRVRITAAEVNGCSESNVIRRSSISGSVKKQTVQEEDRIETAELAQ